MTSYADGQQFSTYDKDNDIHSEDCADLYKGCWWYKNCHQSNLNGQYLGGPHATYADGINWKTWKGYYYSLKATAMMVRRKI